MGGLEGLVVSEALRRMSGTMSFLESNVLEVGRLIGCNMVMRITLQRELIRRGKFSAFNKLK